MPKFKFNHVLINGCSHSAGSEIEGSGIGEGNYNRNNAFGAQLANRLGVEFTNIAYPGASNDYIARTTLTWILDNPKLADNTLFLIHWTGTERTEYFFDQGEHSAFDFISHVPDKCVGHLHPEHYPDWMPRNTHANLDVLSKHLFLNPVQWNINRYNNIIQLQTLLKAKEYPYVFRNAFQCCDTSNRYNYYVNKIDRNNFLHFDDSKHSFFEHCLDKGYSVEGQQYWHHRIEAHTYWADVLFRQSFV